MTKDVAFFLGLVPRQHRDKPKFTATIAKSLAPIIDGNALIASMPEAFDLDEAVGVQLDVVGEWVGRSRRIPVPEAGLFFSFDVAGLGFDEGYWQGPYDSPFGIVNLDDDTYRRLLRGKIASNNWDGLLETAQTIVQVMVTGEGTNVFAVDNMDMTMVIGISGKIPPKLILALLDQNYLPVNPEGVDTTYAVTSSDGAPVFGFDVSNEFIGGFDEGAWGVSPRAAMSL